MLYLIVILMTILSVGLLGMRRDKRSTLIFLTCLSLSVFYFGVLVYIAKKGGISSQMTVLLYGSRRVRKWMQYLVLTLGQLGYIVAVGRYLFPFFLVLAALDMSYFDKATILEKKLWILLILPVFSLILYIPAVFKALTGHRELYVRLLVNFSRGWIFLYLLLTLLVIIKEYRSITLDFFRRRFILKIMLLISLGMLYAFYALQDPAQIYMFYQNEYMWMLGLWYLSPAMNFTTYMLVMLGSVLFGFAGMYTLIKYVHIKFDEEREEVILKRKARAAAAGISMFIHGTKNELLASNILIDRLDARYSGDRDVSRLKEVTDHLLNRIERLNSVARNEAVKLIPRPVGETADTVMDIVKRRYPDAKIEMQNTVSQYQILADMALFPEAVANILINAVEANMENGAQEPVIFQICRERLWISFWIKDRGRGIKKEDRKRIWEPFYSHKNRSHNWGMGMYYARKIIHSHMGSIRFEPRPGGGTSFIILLPRLERRNTR